jgi:hypothetical protein
MKTAEDIRREFDQGENIHTFKPKRAPCPEDYLINAAELDAIKFDAVKFVAHGILPRGLAVLSAPPKIGKTWLDMGLCFAVAAGLPFAGSIPTDQGDVLLLDLEGNRRRAQKRFRAIRQGEAAPRSLEIANEWPRMDKGGLELIRQWAKSRPRPRLVVVDIWVKFRPARPKNADVYQHDYDTIKVLHDLAHELDLAIVVVHHNRKAADSDWLNEISGSQGIAAAADTIITIGRERGSADAVLKASGRDLEEVELAMNFDVNTGCWSIIGDAAEHRMSEARRKVFDLLDLQGPMTPRQVAEELGIPRNTAKTTLTRMQKDGSIKGLGGGKYAVQRR